MEIPFLDLKRFDLDLKKSLQAKFTTMLEEGVFSGGQEVADLESTIKAKLESKYAIGVANGTDAIEIALRVLQVGPGDEVIVPAMTWVSTAEAVVMVGAKPVFWDTDKEGLLASDWDSAINSKTKAVIPVHLYGKMVDMALLVAQAKNHQLFVIEDAAQAFGSVQNGRAAGTWGEIGCLSFYPTKNLGALGEAGMCLTQDSNLEKRIRLLINHGQPRRDEHSLVGRNSRIDTLQAGFLNVMLDRFGDFQVIRKRQAKRYLDSLIEIKGLNLPVGVLDSDHNAHLFVIQTEQREELRIFLRSKGIGTAIHYPKILPEMGIFESIGEFPKAKKIAKSGLSLPLNPFLSESEQGFIIDQICLFFEK
jgi:UDP-2-acetamido-2-deoxy-ribo-hexuluronate aminotransferase